MENKGFETVEVMNSVAERLTGDGRPQEHQLHKKTPRSVSPRGDEIVERPGRKSPPVFRPRRLLHTISNAFVPRPVQPEHRLSHANLVTTGRKQSMQARQPPSHVVDCLQASRIPQEMLMNATRAQRLSNPESCIHHRGRFNIGHPTTCDANIDDDPETNCRARFVSDAVDTIEPSVTSTDDLGRDETNTTINTVSGKTCLRRKKPAVFMNEDCLGRITYPLQKANSVLVRINVSGERFHVFHTTLQKDPYVYSKMLEDAIWLPDEREYYFERDPGVFRFIHNYLRYGEVHLPTGYCGPLLEKELDEWGIPLGLDIQRCCLGPVISSKFKVDSLRKFERHLEPEFIKPSYWIQSPRWQAFRAKVWQVIDVAPRVLHESPMKHRWSIESNAFSISSRYDFSSRKPSTSDDGLDDDENEDTVATGARTLSRVSYNEPPPSQSIRLTHRSGEGLSHLLAIQPRLIINSLSKREKTIIRWARRFYVTYETLIVTSAVLVFMLSTVEYYRVPIITGGSKSELVNSSMNTAFSGSISAMMNQLDVDTRTNQTRVSLPISSIVHMDVFLSVAITIDVVIRMVFCPAIRPWLCSLYTLIDILSLIPFYCEMILYEMIYFKAFVNANDWLVWLMNVEGYIVILKVFVVLRLFRVLRRHRGTRVLLYTIKTTFLDMCIIVILILEGALFFGAAIYFTDENFHSIPRGFWWALITMSTVGYGDLVPTHTIGYVVAMVCVISGTLLMSYTIPILVNHFILYYDHADQLVMVRQLHRSAKRKARSRTMSKYAQKALNSARVLMNATLTNAVAKVNSTMQLSARTIEVKDSSPVVEKKISSASAPEQSTSM